MFIKTIDGKVINDEKIAVIETDRVSFEANAKTGVFASVPPIGRFKLFQGTKEECEEYINKTFSPAAAFSGSDKLDPYVLGGIRYETRDLLPFKTRYETLCTMEFMKRQFRAVESLSDDKIYELAEEVRERMADSGDYSGENEVRCIHDVLYFHNL